MTHTSLTGAVLTDVCIQLNFLQREEDFTCMSMNQTF